MKRILLLIVVCIVLFSVIVVADDDTQQYYRIHIRANSNDLVDQDIKYLIRDAIVDYLTPYLAYADTKSKAESVIGDNLQCIEQIANEVLREAGYDYVANARMCREQFPTRSYGQLTLKSGVYDALVVDLGSAQGDNWWCVIYPPLCFVGESNNTNQIRYVSILKQIIEQFIIQHTDN
ncbi:MAG: stage II sporulation protein R [Clostridia bacterium]|nr:stage II sporulation protein R [Clostridia bacterium]